MNAAERAPIFDVGNAELTEIMADCLQQDFGTARWAKKEIATAVNSNGRAAENWLRGLNLPDALHLLRLIATSAAVRARVEYLCGFDKSPDNLTLLRTVVANIEQAPKALPPVQGELFGGVR